MIHRILMLSILSLVLAACQSNSGAPDPVPASGQRQPSEIASPGSLPISTERATQLFADLCVQQAPTFSGTVAEAIANGFNPNPMLGTYFHPRENLSVTAGDGACTMVFASNADRQLLQESLVSLVPSGMPVVFAPQRFASGNEYYGIRIDSQAR